MPQGKFELPKNPADIAAFRYKVNVEYLMDFLKFAIENIPENRNGKEHRMKTLHSYVLDMESKHDDF
ncbi:hypothetical protein NV379_11570 [Paenibacillus sp. N1-5-1-14]|uniref:hypothetical protein n=1 Tax=Paenibacillus radicibacter TaxID=2972488 RepID=UPI002158DD66|nr:hypothetical protein [Paenibacillus radicibacter]MCR8643301.1 hypothetical protein [Paenibacillus radicibacter]